MAIDPEIFRHKEWLGFLQPVGLVVSPPALVKAQAVVNRNVVELQQAFLAVISRDLSLTTTDRAWIFDFPAFTTTVLSWEASDLVSGAEQLADLEVALPDYGEVLAPTYGVANSEGGWLLLVQVIAPGTNLDDVDPLDERSGKWSASPQAKFERLLRETGVAVGLLFNGTDIRLVYAPRGESSGHLTFPVQAMCEVSGRLILGAMEMLLSAYRLFSAPTGRRLTDLLEESRKYQAEVSTALANQVVDALWELLRGFQAADAAIDGRLLRELAATDPQHIYGGLITTLMRLVFLLYAEDEGLMPGDELYQHNYAVSGLFDRLRADAGNYPDTMDQRYGAWAWLLSLFRLVYDGGGQTPEYLPARHGQLFDPDEYPFLEGRSRHSQFIVGEPIELPRVPDGAVYRMLDRLLILNGERLSYRSLDVEQIGSVYESVMGFAVERATGAAIAVRPQHVVINVENLLAAKSGDRAKLLQGWAACKVSGKALAELKAAKTPEDVLAALGRKVSPRTLNLLPVGTLYLQPGEERRRSGSHYTPRSLTEPIVRTTLRPVLEALGDKPTAEQILSLRIADIAMGSGAFLVEACRQLADQVEAAWNRDSLPDTLPEGEEPLLYARRLVAQRCLYGVDKNPFAVNLARLSLWLVTLSKTLPFTFLDHTLKCGDSLVGFTAKETQEFIAASDLDQSPLIERLKESQNKAEFYLEQIRKAGIFNHFENLNLLSKANVELAESRLISEIGLLAYFASIEEWQKKSEKRLYESNLIGDLGLAAFLSGRASKDRRKIQKVFSTQIHLWEATRDETEVRKAYEDVREALKNISRFHWISEFPKVFNPRYCSGNPGFDCVIGNPPFLGGSKISSNFGSEYLKYFLENYPESHGNSDLVSFFFRRAFNLLRRDGTLGLVATNTIAQGDTRTTGLKWICQHGGTIYNAQKRVRWAGQAAVIVSVLNILKGKYSSFCLLNKKEVLSISAFLFHAGGSEDPKRLLSSTEKSFSGSKIYGQGFLFDDTDEKATPIVQMHNLIEKDPRNQERIFPYIGGEEVNSSPTHAHHRYVINFGEMSEAEARSYPDLMAIVEEKVKPARLKQNREIRARYWWRFGETTPGLFKALAECNQALVCSQTSKYFSFVFLSPNIVFSHKIIVFPLSRFSQFVVLQSRIHEIWVLFFGSTLEDRPVYTPSDCFETFPFPENWETDRTLEAIGKQYYEFRAELMVRNNQGLTETYNRFHDPNEFDPDILRLRQLHEKMDRAVLAAYGWSDIQPQCEFLLDYEDDEDDEENTNKRRRRKPWRYRWNEETHDEVLARLLDLNQKRYEQEILGGASAQKAGKSKKGDRKRSRKAADTETPSLFDS